MLDERVSTSMAIGCAVIALGTAMSSGVLGRRTRAPGHAADVANPKRAFTRSGR
jgi:hypothetical protein